MKFSNHPFISHHFGFKPHKTKESTECEQLEDAMRGGMRRGRRLSEQQKSEFVMIFKILQRHQQYADDTIIHFLNSNYIDIVFDKIAEMRPGHASNERVVSEVLTSLRCRRPSDEEVVRYNLPPSLKNTRFLDLLFMLVRRQPKR